VAPAAKLIRLFAYCSSPSAPQQKNWAGAVPAKKARRAPKKTIKKMRVALPVGDGDSATLAHGALVYNMVCGKREERCRLIAAARELRCAPEVWAREIEETLNDLIPDSGPGGRAATELWQWGRRRCRPPQYGQGHDEARGGDHGRAGPSARPG
jgi:hypothetical protein